MGILEDCLESAKLDRKFASESSLVATREKGAITEQVRHLPLFNIKHAHRQIRAGDDPEAQLQHHKAAKKGNGFSQSLKCSHSDLQPYWRLPAVTPGPSAGAEWERAWSPIIPGAHDHTD